MSTYWMSELDKGRAEPLDSCTRRTDRKDVQMVRRYKRKKKILTIEPHQKVRLRFNSQPGKVKAGINHGVQGEKKNCSRKYVKHKNT